MSVALPDKNWLFLHIPRTGGTWVLSALENNLNVKTSVWVRSNHVGIAKKHAFLGHYVSRRSRKHSMKGVFAFVRHPIAYYESVWMYLLRIGYRRRETFSTGFRWNPIGRHARLWSPEFKEWVEKVIESRPSWYSRLIEMYVGPENAEFCEYVGRTERLATDLVDILRGIGYDIPGRRARSIEKSEKMNISLDRNFDAAKKRLNWTDDLKEKVLYQEREVIERFYGDNFRKIRMYNYEA